VHLVNGNLAERDLAVLGLEVLERGLLGRDLGEEDVLEVL
jgi:hypothetical protein